MRVQVLNALEDIIRERQRTAGAMPLADFGRDLRGFSSFDPGTAQYLFARREEVLRVLRTPQARQRLLECAESGLRFTVWRHNQFLSIRDLSRRRLGAHYIALIRDVETALGHARSAPEFRTRLGRVLVKHHSRLWRTSRHLVDGRFRAALVEPPCSEYSPLLQCQVLGLVDRRLLEPVLDIGCGEHASLVKWLNEQGVQAHGIDRMVPDTAWTWQEDWLSPGGRWRRQRWGTIVSHLAFANHFVHQHLRENGEAESYARLFVEILDRLAPGGSFIYAPAVPFIEDLLPAKYEVVRWTVGSTGLQATRITCPH